MRLGLVHPHRQPQEVPPLPKPQDQGGEDMNVENIEWIGELFDEIEEPTPVDRAAALSLLTAEVEGARP